MIIESWIPGPPRSSPHWRRGAHLPSTQTQVDLDEAYARQLQAHFDEEASMANRVPNWPQHQQEFVSVCLSSVFIAINDCMFLCVCLSRNRILVECQSYQQDLPFLDLVPVEMTTHLGKLLNPIHCSNSSMFTMGGCNCILN